MRDEQEDGVVSRQWSRLHEKFVVTPRRQHARPPFHSFQGIAPLKGFIHAEIKIRES
jgi:hypothetical protein